MTIKMEVLTDVVAAAALTNGAWTDKLQSDLSITLTLVGLVWLLVQIYYKIKLHGKDE